MKVLNKLSVKWVLAAAVAALPAFAVSSPALAGDRDDRDHRDHRDHDHDHVDLNIRIGDIFTPPPPRRVERVEVVEEKRVWVAPVYRTVTDKRFIAPVYRTVVDKRFTEPVYETVVERVWVPDVYETRETRYRDGWVWRVRIERVLVRPGHHETREKRVVVREGRWETFERQELVSEGRWETIEHQELVAEGHYEVQTETTVERRAVPAPSPIFVGFGFRVKK